MKEKNIQFIPYEKLYDRSGFHLVAYWNKLRENKLEDFISGCIVHWSGPDCLYDSGKSVEVNMLRLSVSKGYPAGVKYFWNKITEQERNENITWFITSALENYYQAAGAQLYLVDQHLEITFFFMNYMNEEIKKQVFLKKKTGLYAEKGEYVYITVIFEWCIETWPWQDLFKLLFSKLENLLNKKAYKKILICIFRRAHRQKNSFFLNILFQIWNRIPGEFKSLVLENYQMRHFLGMGNIKCMKLIFFDENMVFKQSDIIKVLHYELHSLMRENKVEKLREFFHEILVPQNLNNDHKETLKLIYDGFLNSDMNLVGESLNCLSKEEREIIRSIVEPDIICYYFIIKNQFGLADQFLSWKFEDEEKVEKFKIDFEENDFIMNQIKNLWNVSKENVELAKLNSDKFLMWLLREEKNLVFF